MSDNVKFIFVTLLKVPIIIGIAYGIFNLFAFAFVFFKMLGVSYVVMQTAVENNYLPKSELVTLYEYVDSFNQIAMIDNAAIIVGATNINTNSPNYITMNSATETGPTVAESTTQTDARRKVQYGHKVTVGVTCDYRFVWPLQYSVTGNGDDVPSDEPINLTGGDREQVIDNHIEVEDNNIKFVYTVPGLKYYPDLLST